MTARRPPEDTRRIDPDLVSGDPFAAVMALTGILAVVALVPVAFNLVGRWLWDDWLSERLGRGSTKDDFPRGHW